MEFLAHRGYWHQPSEQNTETAFRRALASGFGIETDLRDHDGAVVVSHDMPDCKAMTLEAFLELYASYDCLSTLALNIKADGLQKPIADCISEFSLENYFFFDMSLPDTLGYLARGLSVFMRRSEFEAGSRLDARAQGLWLDALEAPCVDVEVIKSVAEEGKRIAIVSPELHRRPHKEAWAAWRSGLKASPKGQFMLCTDFPVDAAKFFEEG